MLKRYFQETFEDAYLDDVAKRTNGFSMAYLKEVYVLSAMISVNRGDETIRVDDVEDAVEVLKQQILTGNKPIEDEEKFVGFKWR